MSIINGRPFCLDYVKNVKRKPSYGHCLDPCNDAGVKRLNLTDRARRYKLNADTFQSRQHFLGSMCRAIVNNRQHLPSACALDVAIKPFEKKMKDINRHPGFCLGVIIEPQLTGRILREGVCILCMAINYERKLFSSIIFASQENCKPTFLFLESRARCTGHRPAWALPVK